jgi:hypothetical protein
VGQPVAWPGRDLMAAASLVEGFLAVGGLRWGEREPVPAQGFLDALGGGASDALVDRQGLLEVGSGVAGMRVLEVAVADSLQGPCFLQGCADLAGDGQRLAVVLAGLAGGRGPGC